MIGKLLSLFGLGGAVTSLGGSTRRKYVRHQAFNADVLINGKKYNVYDWSLGGVSFDISDDATIKMGDKIQVIIEFKFINNDIAISQDAHVVRADGFNCAAKFDPLPQPVKQEFERVLETLYTQSFIESQTTI